MRIIKWIVGIGGFLIGAGAIGGLEMNTMSFSHAVACVFAGTALCILALALPAKWKRPTKYTEYDPRDAYVDELARKRKAEESWKSIKKANEE